MKKIIKTIYQKKIVYFDMQGFILLHRKILENPVFVKAELLQLFIYCILKANHKDKEFIFNGRTEKIKRGSFITGQMKLSKDLKQSQSSVYRRLQVLKKLGYIELKVNNKFTLVTVVKYNTYQGRHLKMNNKRITSEYQVNTNNNDINNEINKGILTVKKFEVFN